MFDKVLIANRGEIAVRIVRACQELGVRAVVAYSQADRDSLAVRLADEAVCIGPAAPARSDLNPPALISAALITGCEAVHPGYGFLAENPAFARACAENDLVFVGPSPDVMERLGDKASAKAEMRAAGVPLVPGTEGAAFARLNLALCAMHFNDFAAAHEHLLKARDELPQRSGISQGTALYYLGVALERLGYKKEAVDAYRAAAAAKDATLFNNDGPAVPSLASRRLGG